MAGQAHPLELRDVACESKLGVVTTPLGEDVAGFRLVAAGSVPREWAEVASARFQRASSVDARFHDTDLVRDGFSFGEVHCACDAVVAWGGRRPESAGCVTRRCMLAPVRANSDGVDPRSRLWAFHHHFRLGRTWLAS